MAEENEPKTTQVQKKNIPEPVGEFEGVLDDLPEEDRQVITKMVQFSMQMGGAMNPQMELMRKMTPEHMSVFLETQKQANQNEYKESRDKKIFLIIALVIFSAVMIAVVILLKDKADILEKVLFAVGGLVSGFFGGYGYGKSKSD